MLCTLAYHLQKHVATVLLEHYAKMCGQTIEYLYLKRPFCQSLASCRVPKHLQKHVPTYSHVSGQFLAPLSQMIDLWAPWKRIVGSECINFGKYLGIENISNNNDNKMACKYVKFWIIKEADNTFVLSTIRTCCYLKSSVRYCPQLFLQYHHILDS